jgi:hypothetical protein
MMDLRANHFIPDEIPSQMMLYARVDVVSYTPILAAFFVGRIGTLIKKAVRGGNKS